MNSAPPPKIWINLLLDPRALVVENAKEVSSRLCEIIGHLMIN